MTEKAPDAFRTISEAAAALDIPAHTLRHWETLFSQIKPMRRSGGRRYYRPRDLQLLSGIQHLMDNDGYSVTGVRRVLREDGVESVIALGALAPPEKKNPTAAGEAIAVPVETLRALMSELQEIKKALSSASSNDPADE